MNNLNFFFFRNPFCSNYNRWVKIAVKTSQYLELAERYFRIFKAVGVIIQFYRRRKETGIFKQALSTVLKSLMAKIQLHCRIHSVLVHRFRQPRSTKYFVHYCYWITVLSNIYSLNKIY